MNNTTIADESDEPVNTTPGATLAEKRMQLNYSVEYVADKLHLRVRVIELLEQDDYVSMPEPVFIKGYIRAYAKLLGIKSEPLLTAFNQSYPSEKKLGRALWQSKRESNKAEHVIRWVTSAFAVIVLIAVAMWWQANKENENIFSSNLQKNIETSNRLSENEIRLTDLSKMRSLLSSSTNESSLEPRSE